jgi:hypothetical protein
VFGVKRLCERIPSGNKLRPPENAANMDNIDIAEAEAYFNT